MAALHARAVFGQTSGGGSVPARCGTDSGHDGSEPVFEELRWRVILLFELPSAQPPQRPCGAANRNRGGVLRGVELPWTVASLDCLREREQQPPTSLGPGLPDARPSWRSPVVICLRTDTGSNYVRVKANGPTGVTIQPWGDLEGLQHRLGLGLDGRCTDMMTGGDSWPHINRLILLPTELRKHWEGATTFGQDNGPVLAPVPSSPAARLNAYRQG